MIDSSEIVLRVVARLSYVSCLRLFTIKYVAFDISCEVVIFLLVISYRNNSDHARFLHTVFLIVITDVYF